ncbi:PilZ domain-containing protein [Vulgatibacter sp.]|uniref:PilZ domain-containing protein n=1 Tax=Vulgatibacter sp. TaxID=1971226 RepID=UPI00356515AB
MYSEPVGRRHPRVPAGFLVKLHDAGRVLVHKARDLSMTGVLLEGCNHRVGEKLVVEIPLPDEQRMIAVTGEVRRGDARTDTTAVYFLDLDWDDLFALARYVAPRLP